MEYFEPKTGGPDHEGKIMGHGLAAAIVVSLLALVLSSLLR